MELSAEDTLRLNVLLAQDLLAVRIDEGGMILHGLTSTGEARIKLNPNCRHEKYLKQVRELLSGHVLGSPGGYPVYLKRWTRMGQAKDESLAQMLMLGEPEAVVAVVHAAGLTDDLARKAWWAMPTADNARHMLGQEAVVRGEMSRELAAYLVDYLPFEEDHATMIETVRRILQPGLIDLDARASVWQRAQGNSTYYVGFLWAEPDGLPDPHAPRSDYDNYADVLQALAAGGNHYAQLAQRTLSGAGQTFLQVGCRVLQNPKTQEVIISLFEAIAAYFAVICPQALAEEEDIDVVIRSACLACAGDDAVVAPYADELQALLDALPQLKAEVCAMLILSAFGYAQLRPVLTHTTAIGTLMCRKLAPVLDPVLKQIACLLGGAPVPLAGTSKRRKRGQ